MSKSEVESVRMLSAEEILAADDLAEEVVDVPEWDGSVLVRELTGTVRDWYQKSLIEFGMLKPGEEIEMKVRLENASVRLCALSIWDKAAGKPMFGLEKVVQLGEKSGKALDRVYPVAQRLSALSDEDVKELVGNSDGTPSDDSSSG